jgi:hypothetical protein
VLSVVLINNFPSETFIANSPALKEETAGVKPEMSFLLWRIVEGIGFT